MEQLPKWDLTDLYANPEDPKIQTDMDALKKSAIAFQAKYQGKLESFSINDVIKEYEEMQSLATKLGVYGRLLSFINLDKGDIQRFFQHVVEFLTDIEQYLTFFTIDLNEISDESKLTGFYKPWLRRVRAMKPYQLDEKMEQLLNDKSLTSSQMWTRLFDETLAKLRFGKDDLGVAAISNLLSHTDESVRKQAAHDIADTLSKEGDLFVVITNTLAKDLEISDKWRGFKGIADSRHLSNDVEATVVDSLFETVQKNYEGLSHRFYKIKAKLLGAEKVSYWDRNAPIGQDDTTYSWDNAKSIVLEAYGSFNADVKAQVQKFFDNPWIDAPESPVKYSGAFNMPTFKGHHPYILLNYKEKLRDVTTLAHELGHGIHSLFADDQGTLMANAPLTLCETASVFGEMLTFQSLLEKAKTKQERVIALESKISDMINTVVRQIAFYDFEKKIHTHRRAQGELSREDLNTYWLETQRKALGPYVDVPDFVQEFWMTIPHFIHSPFYVYAYAFGDCLVNSLYQVYKNSPDGFAEKYMDLLRAGGTKHHKELLSPFGLDASNPDFWQHGMTLIHDFLDRLEAEC